MTASSESAASVGAVYGTDSANPRLRLEIDEFAQDNEVVNLFLLALTELMRSDNYTDRFSWFQIAGIHGMPYVQWDGVSSAIGVEQLNAVPGAKKTQFAPGDTHQDGYCSHSSILFPTWHRGYQSMVEPSIFNKMAQVALLYPKEGGVQQRYLAAVQRFRYPYWDPIMPRKARKPGEPWNIIFDTPALLKTPTVYVRIPSDPTKLIPTANPLYKFDFPQPYTNWDGNPPFEWATESNGSIPKRGALSTIRAPSDDSQVNDNLNLTAALVSQTPALGEKYWNLFAIPKNYDEFSNTNWQTDPTNPDLNPQNSLEGWHNDVHNVVGGGLNGLSGHMAWLQYAGFDPIFWMHHCNVDRSLAIYQGLNPHEWVTPHAGHETFVIPKNTIEQSNTPLLPMRKAAGNVYWTSDGFRDWRILGYQTLKSLYNLADPLPLQQWLYDTYYWASKTGSKIPPASLGYPKNLSHSEALTGVAAGNQVQGQAATLAVHATQAVPAAQEVHATQAAPEAQAVPAAQAHGASAAQVPLQKAPQPGVPGAQLAHGGVPYDSSHLSGLVKQGQIRIWTANIRVQKFALDRSFNIHVFLGEFNQDPNTWMNEKNSVGIDGIFANSKKAKCANCDRQRLEGIYDVDVMPLTAALIPYYKSGEVVPPPGEDGGVPGLVLKSLEPEHVVPFLQRNLHWRVTDTGSVEIPREKVSDLAIMVTSTIMDLPTPQKPLGHHGRPTVHVEITDSREGGLDRGDHF